MHNVQHFYGLFFFLPQDGSEISILIPSKIVTLAQNESADHWRNVERLNQLNVQTAGL